MSDIGDQPNRAKTRRRREERVDHVHDIPFNQEVEVQCPDCGDEIEVGIYGGTTERSYDSCWGLDCDAYHKFRRDRDAETYGDESSTGSETKQTKLVTDGGVDQLGDDADESGPGGTLLLTDEPAQPLRWHHSVEFDGYKHTTACGREIDTDDIRDVFLDPVDAWHERVKPANSCPTCHDSVYQRREFEAENTGMEDS